ncbi:MAG: 50S ribosomal protein L9 [Pseudanabaena sp. SU_2_4]|nr:50S ribosomal protein L9 [Pseudanabaena sp. SU_2_4]
MAKSNVQVMLTKEVKKLGKIGELVGVAPGYAQNYLIPRGFAIRATSGVIKEVERRKEAERQRLLAIRQEAESKKVALSTIGGFIIKKAVGEGNSIFGTVTDREVAQLITDKAMLEIDRRDITVPDIKKTGTFDVDVKLHAEVTATIKLQVVPE